jgi:hypothetical protein
MRDMERKRRRDWERLRAIRAQMYERREADAEAWLRKQLGPRHDPPPPGVSLRQHRAWCRSVLGLPKLSDMARGLPDVEELFPK